MPISFQLPRRKTGLNSSNLQIIKAGIEAVLPANLMAKYLKISPSKLQIKKKSFNLKNKRLFVIGMGKPSPAMAHFLERKIRDQITAGVIVGTNSHQRLKKIEFIRGDHPYPGQNSLQGAQKILDLKKKYNIGKNDIVICLISGGGSALFSLPVPGISLKEKQKTIRLLIKTTRASIKELNCVRKHLSQVKGGLLAEHFQESTVISIIISDVVGNKLDVIASGPTYYDSTTFSQAIEILEKYQLWNKIPSSVKNHLKRGARKDCPETPKKLVPDTHNFIIGTNQEALTAMQKKAKELNFLPKVIESSLEEEVTPASQKILEKLKIQIKEQKADCPLALIYGGETTVDVGDKKGTGGRNQELTLRFLKLLLKESSRPNFFLKDKNWSLISCGTDGIDFINQACGGIISNITLKKVSRKKINLDQYLQNHNSYNFLRQIDGIVSTGGPTDTNVGDVGCFLVK